jgi:D-beta-D-heptose 7-phosphate kinase/D-beta-D-heptose 1-phosphate adenosyltransferase
VSGKNIIDAWADLTVTVIGDVILDSYLEGGAYRLAQEAPVPVVTIAERRHMPGGAANTAANLAQLGARVRLLSVAGDDGDWMRLLKTLQGAGVDSSAVVTSRGRRTIAKRRVVASGQILVRIDEGDTFGIGGWEEALLLERVAEAVEGSDAVVVSDYGYGVVTPPLVAALARRPESRGVLTVDSRHLGAYRDVRPTAVKPNYAEACALLGEQPRGPGEERVAHALMLQDALFTATGAHVVAVSLDVDGSLVFERGVAPYRTFSAPRPGSHASGAGDTFVAALTLALASGTGGQAAAEMAATASEVVLGEDRTTTCTAAALKEAFSTTEKILPADRVAARAEYHRKSGKTVVFTNGVFDILHRGHITYLEQAKALGDVLIVAINTDASVRRLKGPDRPVNSLEDRMHVLASLRPVDHVVAFGDDTSVELIRAVKPDVFVKGGDYEGRPVPEADVVRELGGTVRILPYIDNRSTTLMIERIRRARATASAATGG